MEGPCVVWRNGESIMWGEAHSSKGLPLHNDRCLDGENLGGLKAATP